MYVLWQGHLTMAVTYPTISHLTILHWPDISGHARIDRQKNRTRTPSCNVTTSRPVIARPAEAPGGHRWKKDVERYSHVHLNGSNILSYSIFSRTLDIGRPISSVQHVPWCRLQCFLLSKAQKQQSWHAPPLRTSRIMRQQTTNI